MRLELSLDCAPIEVALTLHEEEYFSFLDSSSADSDRGRYSIFGWRPKKVFRCKNENPLPLLESDCDGDVIGYFAYDLFRQFERHENLRTKEDTGLPDCCLCVYETLLIFDHVSQKWTLEGSSATKIAEREAEIHRKLPSGSRLQPPLFSFPDVLEFPKSNMSRQEYIAAVRTALDYIAAGDIYQVNLSQRFSSPLDGTPFELFLALREINPSLYGAYLNMGDHVVISASPELFLSRQGDILETRPIKGTRPRGKTPEEDQHLERSLIESEKEKAELAMIVDLERNDLGRICDYGSVEVVDPRYLERLPTLLHTAAIVRGRLRDGAGFADILSATFPGGSISGCPKIRATEIIDELEPSRRHVYTGAIGLLRGNGDFRLSIAIRTVVVTGGRVHYQVGSGIVADSIPEEEYEETLQKAVALQRAIASVGFTRSTESRIRREQS